MTDALCAADMTTGPKGQRFTFDERVAEIFSRYGEGSVVQRSTALRTSANGTTTTSANG